MGWSNDQATDLNGLQVLYTNTTIDYGAGTVVTIEPTATLAVNGPLNVGNKLDVVVASTPTQAIGVKRVADAADNFQIYGDGGLGWGAGAAPGFDTNLYRPGAGRLRTDNTFEAAADVKVNGASLPRGLMAYNRAVADLPSGGTSATTKAGAGFVISTSCFVTQGRIYQFICPALSVRMNVAARAGVFMTFAENGVSLFATSAQAGEQYVNCPTVGSPVPVPISCLYSRASASGLVQVALWVWNVSGGGAVVANGTGGPTTTPIEIMVLDLGVDPGANG